MEFAAAIVAAENGIPAACVAMTSPHSEAKLAACDAKPACGQGDGRLVITSGEAG